MIPLLLGVFGLLFHFGGQQVHRFERLAANDLRSKLQGPDMRVSVRAELRDPVSGPFGKLSRVTIRASHFTTPGLPLFTEPQLSRSGEIDELRLELRDLTLGRLHVDQLDATIPNCRFDYGLAVRKHLIRLSRSGEGTGSVSISEKDLESFILSKYHEIKRVKVRIDKDRVFVEGSGDFVMVRADFSVIASIEPLGGRSLILSRAIIFLNGSLADEPSRQALLHALNPVVDLDRDLKLHGAIDIQSVRLRGGVLWASGKTRIPEKPPSEALGVGFGF